MIPASSGCAASAFVPPLMVLPFRSDGPRACSLPFVGNATGTPLSGRAIMIVEDEVLVAVETGLTISDAGGTVLGPFHRLGNAIAFLDRRETPIDAAVLDVNLAGTMVFPLAQRLASRDVPILFQTANPDIPQLRSFSRAAVRAKPVLPHELVSTLMTLID